MRGKGGRGVYYILYPEAPRREGRARRELRDSTRGQEARLETEGKEGCARKGGSGEYIIFSTRRRR